ncbi:MAG TPA: MBL fold metallo-hydrolase [Myxococcota bacterium]|nr:MBL fold metallo-hydrolase [Myxococcota bacterium]
MPTDFVSADEAKLEWTDGEGKLRAIYLLWGDRVEVVQTSGATTTVRARGRTGTVRASALGGSALLELYFIDVGQGDGVLIRTPDGRNVLIDAGFPRSKQATGKNAADFVDWKFVKDDRKTNVELDAMIVSHNDEDHYGGLSDLLAEEADTGIDELDAQDVTVERFYHAGLSWWDGPTGRTLGPTAEVAGEDHWSRLLEDRASVERALDGSANPQLAGAWKTFFERVRATKTKNGNPTMIARLSQKTRHLPGFEPANGKASIRVLGPVERTAAGKPSLRRFAGTDSKQTNGHSVLLRVDYGRARILLTGDLNAAAQRTLLEEYAGSTQELECDVAKACHHGSEDVSYRFLQAMRPAVTVISSGDNEGHDHPRPNIVAASATTGFLQLDGDELVSPLIYSTELARSVDLGRIEKISVAAAGGSIDVKGKALRDAKIEAGDSVRKAHRARMVTNVIYGLVNVRTDGDRILCATRNEGKPDWQIREIRSRF